MYFRAEEVLQVGCVLHREEERPPEHVPQPGSLPERGEGGKGRREGEESASYCLSGYLQPGVNPDVVVFFFFFFLFLNRKII